MKTNRTYRLVSATCIVSLLGFVAVWIFNFTTVTPENKVIPATLGEPSQIDPGVMIPNITENGEINSTKTPGISNRLRINLDAYPQVLDPQKALLPKEIAFLNLMYEGLTRLDDKLSAEPAAAESWQYNHDATELVFRLRRGLVYSDGSPLNALRFEIALQRLLDPATGSGFAWLADDIRGAPEWRQADLSRPGYTKQEYLARLGVKALDLAGVPCTSFDQSDCLVLKLEFTRPAPYFHFIMGLWVAYPVRTEFLDKGNLDWWLNAEKRAGNGPFVLTDLEPFVRARFTPSPGYRGEHPSLVIEFYFFSDQQAALQAYQNNRLEIIAYSLPEGSSAQVERVLSDQSSVIPGACSSMIAFGMRPLEDGQPSPFIDPRIRQAFVLAFDGQGWARDVAGGQSLFSGTFIPPGFSTPGDVNPPYAFDPPRARQVLAESAYGSPQALNDLDLTLIYPDTPLNQQRFTWLADNYRRHLGVELTLKPLPSDEYSALLIEPGFSPLLGYQSWCSIFPDPQSWLVDYWQDGSPFRPDSGYTNPELQVLLDQAGNAVQPVERLSLYVQAHQLLLDDAPAIFGLVPTSQYLVKPWVKGLVSSPFDSVWPGSLFPEEITIEP